jgi:hypothetical protein
LNLYVSMNTMIVDTMTGLHPQTFALCCLLLSGMTAVTGASVLSFLPAILHANMRHAKRVLASCVLLGFFFLSCSLAGIQLGLHVIRTPGM